jgi:hypothetical protein
MYVLPQDGILANQLLKERLGPHGYTKCNHTPGLWQHNTRSIKFVLVVDNFGIQYSLLQDAQHLLAALKQHYEAITVDWEGTQYCGITLQWNYEKRTVDLSMPGYVQAALDDFNFTSTSCAEPQPHRHNPPQYGVKTQLTDPINVTTPLDNKGNLRLQQITRKFQYYSWAVDPTMNVTLSTIASQQTRGMQQTQKDANKFLHYCYTHPDAKICYHTSDMILKVHLDTSYNSKPKARSQASEHFYMGNQDTNDDTRQCAILATTSIMQPVLSSTSKAEIGALYENTKKAAILCITLHEMGHPQPATTVQTNNSTACSITNDNIKQQRSHAIDMRFYWIQDRVK